MFDEYQYKGSVSSGLGLTLLLHLIQIPMDLILGVLSPTLGFGCLIFIGVSQLVYMIPAILNYKKKGETETVKGLIIGASVTFLLNAACTGILFGNLQRM